MWVPGILALACFVLAPYRSAFYRHARLLSGRLQRGTAIPLFGLIGCILALAVFERHVRFVSYNSWWKIVASPEVPNSVRLAVGMSVLVGAIAIWAPAAARRGHADPVEPRNAPALCEPGWHPAIACRRCGLGGGGGAPRFRSAASDVCCSVWAIRPALTVIARRPSGACGIWRSARGATPRLSGRDRSARCVWTSGSGRRCPWAPMDCRCPSKPGMSRLRRALT